MTMSVNILHTFIYICVVVIAMSQNSYSEFREMSFFGGQICDVNDRIEDGCSEQVLVRRNRFECISACMEDSDCVGSSTDLGGSCFKHQECPSRSTCVKEDINHVYMSKQCDNKGTWVPKTSSCKCVGNFVGKSCQDYPSSCSELMNNGYSKDFHRVILDPGNDFKDLAYVCCYMDPSSGYYNMVVMMNDGNTNFNFSWSEYRDGVYLNNSQIPVWVGLRNWHFLSQLGYTQLFLVVFVEGLQGSMYMYYSNFKVSGEEDDFAISFNSYATNLARSFYDRGNEYMGDCFGDFQNTPFSTWDHDQDTSVNSNCASGRGVGWWYKDCDSPCNLMGWGTSFWDEKPTDQLMKIKGFDIEQETHRKVSTMMYLSNTG